MTDERAGTAPPAARLSAVRWPLAAYGVGLVVGPLLDLAEQGSPDGQTPAPTVAASLGVLAVLAALACWAWFAYLSRAVLGLRLGRSLAACGPVLLTGSVLWLLPGSPWRVAHGSAALVGCWLGATLPCLPAALVLRPGAGVRLRAGALVGALALLVGGSTAGHVLTNRYVASRTAALGVPASLYRVIDAPGFTAQRYHNVQGVLRLGYTRPQPDPLTAGTALVLSVVPTQAGPPCQGGVVAPTAQLLGTACRVAPHGGWWLTDPFGTTTLLERDGSAYVGLSVDRGAAGSPSPSRLRDLLATLHTPDHDQLDHLIAGV